MRTPNSGNEYARPEAASSSVCAVSGPFGCSHHSTPCAAANRRSRSRSSSCSGSRWRSTSAVVVVADRQLDLRQAVAGPHRADQRAQRQQQRADMRRQDLAAADVGDVARLALVEADQHRALLHHVAHREPRPLPVAPGRALDRPQHLLRRAPCRDARAHPRARAAWSRPAPRRAGAASRSRRRRRSADSAARPAALLGRRSATIEACSQLFLRRRTATCTSSPASASSTKTTLPSALCATPCASRSSDSMRSHSSVLVMRQIIRGGTASGC